LTTGLKGNILEVEVEHWKDDWETLDENTKQARLDGAIAQLTEIE